MKVINPDFEYEQIPVIPEDIFFTSNFSEVVKLEDSRMVAPGLVSQISVLVMKSP